MLKQLKKRQEGFTIVEVLIVLAIAGVIMLVVFLAVPTLQRNSRNTQRRADVSHLGGVLNEWIGNHQGSPLAKWNTATITSGPTLASETFSQMNGMTPDAAGTGVTPAASGATVATYTAAVTVLDNFYVYSNTICTNSTTPAYSSSAKSYAILYLVEPGSPGTLQCASI
jgi:prepilin-type N-terminal cleavage/methylation domain-containing protein